MFYVFPRALGEAEKTEYLIKEEIETIEIPETEQIELPEPPARQGSRRDHGQAREQQVPHGPRPRPLTLPTSGDTAAARCRCVVAGAVIRGVEDRSARKRADQRARSPIGNEENDDGHRGGDTLWKDWSRNA